MMTFAKYIRELFLIEAGVPRKSTGTSLKAAVVPAAKVGRKAPLKQLDTDSVCP
jgi:hypothetical protein